LYYKKQFCATGGALQPAKRTPRKFYGSFSGRNLTPITPCLRA